MNSIERTLRTKNLLWFNFLFWLLFCVFAIIKSFSFAQSFNFQFNANYLIQWPIASYLTYWILSFAVFQGFISSSSLHRSQFFTVHVISGIIFGIIHKLISPVIAILLERLFLTEYTLSFSELLPLNIKTWYDIILSVTIYWMIIIVLFGINYYRKFQDQTNKRLELETALSASHLKTMKMQLHPHFLFNAFNTIVMMIRRDKKDEAINMISSLSEMLRQSLGKETSQFVLLEEEISLLKNYLAIESQRYKDRITIKWNLDEQLNKFEVPSFILQPIVENAFKHGISRNLEHSVLEIYSRRKGQCIELEIFNTGSKLPKNWEFQKDKGIGLANTSARLMELYKNDIRFLIKEKEDGVSVVLQLPIRDSLNS
jgi:two-component system LytT family sensor kinase